MSRNVIIAIVVAVILVGGGAAWYANSRSSNEPASTSATNGGGEQSATNTSLNSITSGGKSQQCSMQYSGSNGNGSGQIYTDGNGRGRYTFNATTEQSNSGQINQIVNRDAAYSWFESNGQTIGFKTNPTASSGSSSSSGNSAPDPNQQFSMSCSSWNVDEAMFGLPAGVNFLDSSALVPSAQ